MQRSRFWASIVALGAVSSAPRVVWGHIDLIQPIPRAPGLSADPNANLKEGPCGQLENGRTEQVNVFAPGQTISVEWDEFVNHRSYYRVAFDIDGDDDFPIFPGTGTSPVGDDPTRTCPVDGHVILAYELNDGGGLDHTLQVTLPDVVCENCTLQVIQYMYDTGRPYYFQCADLALRTSDAEDAGSLDASASAALDADASPLGFHAADSCSMPLPPRPRRDAGAAPTPVPTETTDDGNGTTPDPDPPSEIEMPVRPHKDRGCSLVPSELRTVGLGALFAMLIALVANARSLGRSQRTY